LKDGQVQVRWDNMPLTAYRAIPSQKYPYFYPLNGLASGTSLTAESALPYPHHRGLWLGCEPLNGGDYWADNGLESGQVKSEGLNLGRTTERSAEILDRCRWIRNGAPSRLSDERKFTIAILNDRVWVVDAEIKLTANEDVEIKKAKHSFFAIRAASDISCTYGGVLANSEGGEGAEGTYGKEARWCGYHGKRAGRPDVVEGIAVMTHPDNPWKPTLVYARVRPSVALAVQLSRRAVAAGQREVDRTEIPRRSHAGAVVAPVAPTPEPWLLLAKTGRVSRLPHD